MQTDAETLNQRLRCSPTLAVMEQGIRWVLCRQLWCHSRQPGTHCRHAILHTSVLTDSSLWLIIAGMTGTEAFPRAITQPLENTDENSGF